MDYRLVRIDPSAHIAPDCSILGDVLVGAEATVFSGARLRGDYDNRIVIGARSNIQENCCLHVNRNSSPTVVGNGVTVGHGAILHGCTIGDGTLVGMGSIVMDNAHVGKHCIIAAGAVVTENARIPDRSLVVGCPGRIRREVTEDEIALLDCDADEYVAIGADLVENGFMLAGDAIPADHPTIAVRARA